MQVLAATQPCHLAAGQGVSKLPWPWPAKNSCCKLRHTGTAGPSAHGHPRSLPAAPQKQAGCDKPPGWCKSSAGELGKASKTGSWHLDVAQGHPRGAGFSPVGWAKAGSRQKKKILVPTKRQVSLQHPSYLDKIGGGKHFKEILKELEPQGRWHQRQWFPISSSNGKVLAEVIPKKGPLC